MNIVYQVDEAIEDEGFLPINTKISLEYLSSDLAGIFENEKSWKSFVNGNFLSDYSKQWWRASVKESTIKKWCRPEKEYKHLFVVKTGKDKYQNIDPDDIELTFEYELRHSVDLDFPSIVEIFVTANFKV